MSVFPEGDGQRGVCDTEQQPVINTIQSEASPTPVIGFCTNCGFPLSADTAFCTKCGEPISQRSSSNAMAGVMTNVLAKAGTLAKAISETGKKVSSRVLTSVGAVIAVPELDKKISSRVLAIIGAIIAVVVVLFALVLFKSPSQKFVSYQKNFISKSCMGLIAGAAEYYNSFSTFSTDIVLTGESDNENINNYLEDSSIELNIDFNKNSLSTSGKINLMDNMLLSGIAQYDKGTLSFAVPEADNRQFSMDFAELLGTNADITGLTFPEIDVATLKKLGTKYTNILLSVATKDNVTVSKKDGFRLRQLKKNINGTLYECQPSADDIETMLNTLADTVEKDKELYKFILDFIGTNIEFVNNGSAFDFESETQDLIDYFVEDIRYSAESTAENLEDNGLVWSLGVSKGRVCLLEFKVQGSNINIAYESAGNEKDKRSDIFYAAYDNSIGVGVKASWSRDGKLLDGKIEPLGNGDSVNAIKFSELDFTKRSVLGIPYGEYEMFYRGNPTATVNVHAAKGGGTNHLLSVINNGDIYILNQFGNSLDVNVYTSDKKATSIQSLKGKSVNLSEYDMSERYEILSELRESISLIFTEIFQETVMY